MISTNSLVDFTEHIVSFIGLHALKEWEINEFSIELSIQHHKLEGLSFEPFTFKRVIKDSTINQIFDKVVYPAWLLVNLVDFFDFLDAWDFLVLYVN